MVPIWGFDNYVLAVSVVVGRSACLVEKFFELWNMENICNEILQTYVKEVVWILIYANCHKRESAGPKKGIVSRNAS